jgi:hypothetical protein
VTITIRPPRRPSDLRSHLRFVHGIWAEDEKSTAGLRECHASDHQTPWSHTRVSHTHQ